MYFADKVSESWKENVEKMEQGWLRHVTNCTQLHIKIPTLIVKFENLKSNLFVELKRMLDFLEVPYTDEDIECTVNSKSDSFHRIHHDKSFNPYSPQQRQSIVNVIKEANVVLNQFGINYDTD